MNAFEMEKTGKWILSIVNKKEFFWFLQPFVSRNKGEINDVKLSLENLPKKLQETPRIHLENLKIVLDEYCNFVEIR